MTAEVTGADGYPAAGTGAELWMLRQDGGNGGAAETTTVLLPAR